jgi:hypothetical protein
LLYSAALADNGRGPGQVPVNAGPRRVNVQPPQRASARIAGSISSEMIDLLAVEEPKPKPAKIRAVSYEAAIDQLFKTHAVG